MAEKATQLTLGEYLKVNHLTSGSFMVSQGCCDYGPMNYSDRNSALYGNLFNQTLVGAETQNSPWGEMVYFLI